jgi:hypothetical protein
MHQQGPISTYWAHFVDGAFPCGWQPDFHRIPCRFTVMLPRCRVRCSVVGISKVEPSISTVNSSRESPRTSMLRRSASLSNSDQSAKSPPAASKCPSWQRAVVDVRPKLGGHHAALASPMQDTPTTG